MEILIYSLSESMFISMKPLEVDTFREQSSWIWNPEPWTLYVQVHLVNCSVRTTLCLDRQVRSGNEPACL